MARDAEQPPVAPTPKAQPIARPLPAAWQPLTWRGVAAFAGARLNRLLLAQTAVAILAVTATLWFLNTGWFPIIRKAIQQLPDTGAIENQRLISPHSSREPLIEHRLLTFVVDQHGAWHGNSGGDLRIEFHREQFAVCSALGCYAQAYPKAWSVPFNQPDLQSHWGAWETMIYLWVGLAVFLGLFISWWFLATVYSPFVRLYAFFKDRDLSLAASWKLAGAALLPCALLVSVALVLYSAGILRLFHFLAIWLLHFPLGWVYLWMSPLRLPAAGDALPGARQNPFGDGEQEQETAPANPFVGEQTPDNHG